MAEGGIPSEAQTVPAPVQAKISPPASGPADEISNNIGSPENTPPPGNNPVLVKEKSPSGDIKLKPEEQQAIEAIASDPEYQQMLQEKILQAQAEGKKVDSEDLKLEVLAEYLQEESEEAENREETEQKIPLTPEQKKAISKEFGRAFKEIPEDMKIITKKTFLPRKAKASESTIDIQKEYDTVLKKIENSAFGKNNQRAIEYLKESLDNADILKLLKKEKNKNLLMSILKMVFMMGFGAGKETGEYLNPLSKMR